MPEVIHKEYTVLETLESGKALVNYLLRRWYIIVLVVLVFGVLGVLYAWMQKPVYKATLTFSTESSGGGLGAYAGIAAQFGLDIGGGSNNAFEGGNLIELLKSRDLVERTLLAPVEPNAQKLLIDHHLEVSKTKEGWKKEGKLQNLVFVPYPSPPDRIRDSIIGQVYKSIVKGKLNVGKPDKKLDIIEISMNDGDEFFAKRFVELLTDNAIDYYTEYKVGKSRQNVSILQRQTDSIRGTLFGNISQVATMNDLNVNPLRQVVRVGAQRKQVDVQANAAIYSELVKHLELSKLTLRKETPLIQIIDTPKFPLEKKKLGRLMGGIIFAFIGGFLVVAYLLIRYWLQGQRKTIIAGA